MATHYGIREQNVAPSVIDSIVETIRLRGYADVDVGFGAADITRFADAFQRAYQAMQQHFGLDSLSVINEQDTIRLPLSYERKCLQLATNPVVLSICRQLLGEYVVLSQQNGVINRGGARHVQAQYHRDLPYQHFVSSRPLAISALYCVDPFTTDNGATWVIPASHKQDAFPSNEVIESLQVQLAVPAGRFLVMDAMVFHAGGVNHTERARRAVNHVYTLPFIKPQIDLPAALGDAFSDDLQIRRLLGYDVSVPRDVASFYAARLERLRR